MRSGAERRTEPPKSPTLTAAGGQGHAPPPTYKITRAAARIKLGLQDVIYLGNLDAKRDWGFAGDYVETSFAAFGITIEWKGSGTDEIGIDADSGTVRVRIDPRYFRPAEVELLLGDPSKAKEKLRWEPKVTFGELVSMMVQSDLQDQGREAYLRDGGYEVKRYHE